MPVRLTWEPPHGVFREYLGDVTIAQRRESFDAICGDPRFDDLLYCITDFQAVGHYEMTDNATAEIAALHVGPLRTNSRLVIASVVTRPDILEAIRQFTAYGFTSSPYQVFQTIAEARRWVASIHPRAIIAPRRPAA